MRATLPLLLVVGLGACKQDQEIVPRSLDSVAVTQGDFDNVAEPLNRMVVAHTEYEGLISTAVWDPYFDPTLNGLKVETLFQVDEELRLHDSILVASGTRGLGAREYNGLDPDDHLVADQAVIDNVYSFVSTGRIIVATDWAYDLVEATFPDHITFLNDDAVLDDAQHGEIGVVVADVVHPRLVDELESATMAVEYNYSNWAVVESVSDSVEVWLTGDVAYRVDSQAEPVTLQDVPLLVSFEPWGPEGGVVVYSTFHLDAQTAYAVDQILRTVVGDFKEGELAPETIE